MIKLILKISRTFLPALVLLACGPRNLPPLTKPTPLTVTRFTGAPEIQTNSNPWTPILSNQLIQSGSRLRTATNSLLDLAAASTGHRILLSHASEVKIERWAEVPKSNPDVEEVQIEVQRGLLLIDLPPLSAVSKFELKGSNFVAGVRAGPTVAAINADGSVLVQAGTIVYLLVSSTDSKVTAFTLNPGQMFDPVALTVKRIPSSSNQVWHPLSQ